jgi:hypothetical protein
MKLTTDIKPRKDGTVIATVPGTESVPTGRYVFTADGEDRLMCDVEHDSHIGWLLDSGLFYPADEADIDAGISAVNRQDEGEDGQSEDAPADEADIDVDATEGQVKAGKKKGK